MKNYISKHIVICTALLASLMIATGAVYDMIVDANGYCSRAVSFTNSVKACHALYVNTSALYSYADNSPLSLGTTWQVITGASAYSAATGNGYIIDATANAVTLNLPAPALGTSIYFIVRNKDNTCTVARNGSESIDGTAGNLVLDTLRGANGVVSDGTNWYLLYK